MDRDDQLGRTVLRICGVSAADRRNDGMVASAGYGGVFTRTPRSRASRCARGLLDRPPWRTRTHGGRLRYSCDFAAGARPGGAVGDFVRDLGRIGPVHGGSALRACLCSNHHLVCTAAGAGARNSDICGGLCQHHLCTIKRHFTYPLRLAHHADTARCKHLASAQLRRMPWYCAAALPTLASRPMANLAMLTAGAGLHNLHAAPHCGRPCETRRSGGW